MNLWHLSESNARLDVGLLKARVDVANPALGLHELVWNGAPIAGSLMGLTVAEEGAPPVPPSSEGIDLFVRGSDLVANYPQSESQRFTSHMYWRIASSTARLVVIDAILSLQTSLLECFPKAVLTTNLPDSEILAVASDGAQTKQVGECLTSDEPAGVLVRGGNSWSYFEMTHPADLGRWRISRQDNVRIERELGGEFQEKGVIRRLRVRGAFVVREDDVQTARQILAEFVDSEPPLTA